MKLKISVYVLLITLLISGLMPVVAAGDGSAENEYAEFQWQTSISTPTVGKGEGFYATLDLQSTIIAIPTDYEILVTIVNTLLPANQGKVVISYDVISQHSESGAQIILWSDTLNRPLPRPLEPGAQLDFSNERIPLGLDDYLAFPAQAEYGSHELFARMNNVQLTEIPIFGTVNVTSLIQDFLPPMSFGTGIELGSIELDGQDLSVVISPIGSGAVTLNPATPQEYDDEEEVALNAVANQCYNFAGWSGDVGTIADVNDPSTTITMNGDYSITANFTQTTYNLIAAGGTGGSVTIPGEGNNTYTCGQAVNLVATPDSGYVFTNWTGDVSGIADANAASTTITMNGDYSITANFIATYNLVIGSTAGGSVNVPGEGTFTYDSGTVVALQAAPISGYEFQAWTGNTVGIANATSAVTSITMNGDYSIIASFGEVSGGGGGGSGGSGGGSGSGSGGGSGSGSGGGSASGDADVNVDNNETDANTGDSVAGGSSDGGALAEPIVERPPSLREVTVATVARTSGGIITAAIPAVGADFTSHKAEVGRIEATINLQLKNNVPEDAAVRVTASLQPETGVSNAFQLAATDAGLGVVDVAYTVNVTKTNLQNVTDVASATITMTVGREWVESYGDPNAIRIFRYDPDTGAKQVLQTNFLGYDAEGRAIFEGFSPDGLSVFGLVAIRLVPVKYNLVATIDPAAGGSVTLSPMKPADGYEAGMSVTLSAIANEGYTFDHWGGDYSGTDEAVTVIIGSDMSVTAHFTKVPSLSAKYSMVADVDPTSSGTIILDPMQPASGYEAGTVVTLAARANEGYNFNHWSGDASGTEEVVTVTIDSDESVTAHFTEIIKLESDTIAPMVISASPGNGARDVAVDAGISVTFSEDMDEAATEGAFAIDPSVNGTLTWVDHTLIFDPDVDLAKDTSYIVTISTSAGDLAGNDLAASYAWSFFTEESKESKQFPWRWIIFGVVLMGVLISSSMLISLRVRKKPGLG